MLRDRVSLFLTRESGRRSPVGVTASSTLEGLLSSYNDPNWSSENSDI